MLLKVVPVGPLAVNSSIIVDKDSGEAVIVDPGAEADKLISILKEYKPKAIINTHGHIDHVGQVAKVKEAFNIPFLMHKDDVFLINDEIWRGFASQIGALKCPQPDEFIEEGTTYRVGNTEIRVLHTPGHTPGSCCLFIEKEGVLIAGDLLFKGGVGRWDLPGGDFEKLKRSLERIFTEMEDDTLVVCGHYE
jgi:glyoxylase-like metal-dependent hydrolase (beta-lactamase superfamily II)